MIVGSLRAMAQQTTTSIFKVDIDDEVAAVTFLTMHPPVIGARFQPNRIHMACLSNPLPGQVAVVSSPHLSYD